MHLPSLNLDTPRFVARDEQGLPKSWTFEAGRSLGDGLALVRDLRKNKVPAIREYLGSADLPAPALNL